LSFRIAAMSSARIGHSKEGICPSTRRYNSAATSLARE
jgi:hypothetical protein